MGNYNPDAPVIIGNEWAGIHDENIQLSPDQNTVEYGYTMTLAGSRTVTDARFYTHIMDDINQIVGIIGPNTTDVIQVNVYPYGQEANVGPIKRVVIPIANMGFVSGNGNYLWNVPDGTQVIGGGNGTGALPTQNQMKQTLFNPQSGGNVSAGFYFTQPFVVDNTKPNERLMFQFDIASYAQQLLNKRILAVNFIFRLWNDNFADAQSTLPGADRVSMQIGGGLTGTIGNTQFAGNTSGPSFNTMFSDLDFQRISHGEVQNYWQLPFTNAPRVQTSQFVPWTLSRLMNLDPSVNLMSLSLTRGNFTANSGGEYHVTFMALEVIYCEETRVAAGGLAMLFGSPNLYNLGANVCQMFDPKALTPNPVLSAGKYTVTISSALVQLAPANFGVTLPPFNGMRPLYDISSHNGRKITKPSPVWNAVDESFTVQDWPVMPQVTLHDTTGAPIVETHVYGRRIAVPVYGAITAVQTAEGSPVQVGATYDQVRFYARRFGLTSHSLSVTLQSGATASITPAAFDALPEIIDGWAEVTLPLAPTFVPANTNDFTVTWASAGELAGSRWEVLGVNAPALSGSGVVGSAANASFLSKVPTIQRLSTATYLQPTGDTNALTWLSPTVSGTASDPESDAVFLVSQSPAAPTGLTLTALSLALTGVGVSCPNPMAMPTGMTYNRLTWTTSPVTGSGFGYYDLQRLDTIGNVWESIMQITTQAVTGFSDFEARVGILTSYRLRVVNALGFAGPFSSTVQGTIATSGVTGTRVSADVFMFTSNVAQSGIYSLAYVEALPTPSSNITFPEASRTKLEWVYAKDYQSAFMPLERGGESFTTTILVQQVAVTPPIVQGAIKSLRDLGWAQLPYVCVRNDLGDRWYANVMVPSATIQRNRTLQMASITVTEITGTPYVVTSVT